MPIDIPPALDATDFRALDFGAISSQAAYHTMTASIVPRPIAFISTIGPGGIVNAAPFSFFNGVTSRPPIVSIAVGRRAGERKDTSRNIAEHGEFVINVVPVSLARAISVAAGEFEPDVSEVDLTGLSTLPSTRVKPPRIANAPVHFECVLEQMIPVGDGPATDLVLGRIVEVHVHASVLNADGRIDVAKLDPLARLSGNQYAQLHDFFDVPRGLPEE